MLSREEHEKVKHYWTILTASGGDVTVLAPEESRELRLLILKWLEQEEHHSPNESGAGKPWLPFPDPLGIIAKATEKLPIPLEDPIRRLLKGIPKTRERWYLGEWWDYEYSTAECDVYRSKDRKKRLYIYWDGTKEVKPAPL